MTSEKVSVNIPDEALSKIDLLIEDGFYSNRSDFINRAVSTLLEKESRNIEKLLQIHSKEKIHEHQWFMGIQTMGTAYLEKVKERGLHLRIKGFGVLYIEKDTDSSLVFDTIEFISGKIRIFADDGVREHYRVEKEKKGSRLVRKKSARKGTKKAE